MNEIPMCFSGCCNVRTWTITIAIVSTIMCSVKLLHSIIAIIKYDSKYFEVYMIILMLLQLFISLRLGSGALKNDLTFVRIWLWFVFLKLSIETVLYTLVIILVVVTVDFNDPKYAKWSFLENEWVYYLITYMLFTGFMALVYYPVYQYYKFEKNRLPQ